MRVAEYRLQALQKMRNVQIYLDSELEAGEVLAFGFSHVFLATGAVWRRDGLGRQHRSPLVDVATPCVFTPDDVFAGATLPSPVLIYDDDHYYMAGALAERLCRAGHEVHLVTPSAKVSEFTEMTMEQQRIQSGLMRMGVHIHTNMAIASITPRTGGLSVTLSHTYSEAPSLLECASLLLVTMRDPGDSLYRALLLRQDQWQSSGVKSISLLGDAQAPGSVAAAVYAGHRAARALDAPALPQDAVSFKRERIALGPR
jgi:dimethylamine/trimethylamine dehydrogenase